MPTISDVARHAEVSPATVSRVLQGSRNVRPDTRARVERAIDDLGYVPSAVAQSLRSKKTRSIALVVPDITNTFWTTVARGVQDVAHEQDYSVLLSNTDENLEKQLRYLGFLVSQQVDGVLIAPYGSEAHHLDALRARNIPTVILDRRINGWDVDSVLGDSVSGARTLVRHLIQLGHRHIAVVSGPHSTTSAEDRVAGYRIALAEAGLPIDSSLIKRGEYRRASGMNLTLELLDQGAALTAIFAANNAIARGVIDVLASRDLRIPQDIALACFDDLPNTSHVFPFLTVVAQPAYDMGVNAAQMLLSRIESDVPLRPRHVTLPLRLLVRHSCGSQLTDTGDCPLSLPIPDVSKTHSVMVKPLSAVELETYAPWFDGISNRTSRPDALQSKMAKSDLDRVLKALRHQEADRIPHVELRLTSQRVYEYVLEREVELDLDAERVVGSAFSPEDHVHLAQRLGLDAVACRFVWIPKGVDTTDPVSSPSLTRQLGFLERYLRAAQGTGVGVIASFSSFFAPAVAAHGSGLLEALRSGPHHPFERLMDALLDRQERTVRVICDRFATDLALVMIDDRIADGCGLILPLEVFRALYERRMRRLIEPASEHGLPLGFHSEGHLVQALSLLFGLGFHAVHPLDPANGPLLEQRHRWSGRLAFMGGFPMALLENGKTQEIEAHVRDLCSTLAPGGGFILGASGVITEAVPPENLVAMTRAARTYGRYGILRRQAEWH